MADQTYQLGPSITLDRREYANEHDYVLVGSGNLSGIKSKFITYSPKWIEVYIEGKFDSIEDNCFSHDNVKYIEVRYGGGYKHIRNNCFRSSKLERITLPETLETIGHNNFSGLITSFNIPSKIADFPADNLKDCHKLTTITVSIGNTSYRVLDGVLYNFDLTIAIFCPNAMNGNVILPNTVEHIGEYCFYGCKKLKKIVIPPSIKTIGNYAFSECSIDKLVIPNSVKSIGTGCFKKSVIRESLKLSSQIFVIPDECFKESDIKKLVYSYCYVTEIGNNAIGNIKKDIIPQYVSFYSLKYLGISALNYCNETEIFEFFSCLEKIDDNAFQNTKDKVKIKYFSSSPIRLSANVFRGLSENATLIVPRGSKIIFQNAAPWSLISNICECELDIDINENGEEIIVTDEIHLKRLKSVAESKIKADRYFLKEIIEELCLNYFYVDNDDEYNEALEVIKYNRSFSPAIISDLEQRMCQNWTNKYKLKLASITVLDNPASIVTMVDERTNISLPAVDIMALPAMEIDPFVPEQSIPSVQVIFNEDIQKQLQNILTLAKKSLKIAVSWFTNYSLLKQVKEIATTGIKVQLITNNDLTNNGGYCLNLNELINEGVEINLIEYPHLLHHKFCIVDDDVVVNGSYNWTRFSSKNYENITVICNDSDAVEAFSKEFENLLENAEHKCIKEMPEFVPERPEYDRSAFRQYVTEELDAEARETSDERHKITALQKAVSLNSEYLGKINPEAKKNYAEAFKTVNESVSMQNTIAAMVEDKTIPMPSAPIYASSSLTGNSTTIPSGTTSAVAAPAVVSRATQQIVEKVKASELFMVLDVSGSMRDTYNAGHVHGISRKALSASLAITDSKEVLLWTFGDNAQFIGTIGIDSISKIDQVHCKNEGTELKKFVEAADSYIKDNALVIIFTDDDSSSITAAISAMQKRINVFWQIIVYGVTFENISKSISNIANTSVISFADYASKTEEQISNLLLKDYIDWKKN